MTIGHNVHIIIIIIYHYFCCVPFINIIMDKIYFHFKMIIILQQFGCSRNEIRLDMISRKYRIWWHSSSDNNCSYTEKVSSLFSSLCLSFACFLPSYYHSIIIIITLNLVFLPFNNTIYILIHPSIHSTNAFGQFPKKECRIFKKKIENCPSIFQPSVYVYDYDCQVNISRIIHFLFLF